MDRTKSLDLQGVRACLFYVLRINDGRKTLKESIMLMQSLAGIDLRQGLHFQYITMILEILNGLIYSG